MIHYVLAGTTIDIETIDGESIITTYTDGSICWFNSKKELHRLDGPAMEQACGSKFWYQNNKIHRKDGPAVESSNGDKEWYWEGQRHRLDGPAVEQNCGSRFWFQNNNLHRVDGPAVLYASGTSEWYIEGKFMRCRTQEEFERLMRLKAFW